MSIPYMKDPDGTLREGIENLRVTEPVDESPEGRVRCLDSATHAVYEEMYSILTGSAGVTDPQEYETRLLELAEQLSDLHEETVRAFDHMATARFDEGGQR